MSTYHHGDLRRAVLDAALDLITQQGPAAISLRDLARRAGVSHAAPAHHFKDKAGLLTAIAVEGYELLADSLQEQGGELRELGVRYVDFALEYPAHFEVMFRPDLYRRDDADIVAAKARLNELLRGGVAAIPGKRRGRDAELASLAAWSLAHGFATLWRGDNLGAVVGDRDPLRVFRGVARSLFAR